MKAASQYLTPFFRSVWAQIMTSKIFFFSPHITATSSLHQRCMAAASRCPCWTIRPKRRNAHHNIKRDTLHLTVYYCLCSCWTINACDSISFETIWTWSNIFRTRFMVVSFAIALLFIFFNLLCLRCVLVWRYKKMFFDSIFCLFRDKKDTHIVVYYSQL